MYIYRYEYVGFAAARARKLRFDLYICFLSRARVSALINVDAACISIGVAVIY